MKDKMMGELKLGTNDSVIKEYRRLCEQAGKKVPTYNELRKVPKEKLMRRCLSLRNHLILFG